MRNKFNSKCPSCNTYQISIYKKLQVAIGKSILCPKCGVTLTEGKSFIRLYLAFMFVIGMWIMFISLLNNEIHVYLNLFVSTASALVLATLFNALILKLKKE